MSNDKLIPKLRFAEFQNEAGWQEKTLAEFSDLESGDGNWILSKDITSNGEFKIVQLSSIGFGLFKEKTLKTISNETFLELNGTPIQKGDLLLNRMVDSNKINCCIFPYDGKYVTSVDVCWIRNNPFFNNYFLLSLICEGSSQNKLLSLSSGAGRVRISKKNLFEKFSFLLPKNPQEQQKIAICLSSLDEVIAANSQKLDLLKDHKKGLMQNHFPQEGETVPKYRFKEFDDDGDWVEQKLGDYIELLSGYPFQSQYFSDEGQKLIIPKNFTKDGYASFSNENTKYTTENVDSRYWCKEGDLLLLLTDLTPSCELLGKPVLLKEKDGQVLLNQRIIKVMPRKEIYSDFLLQFFLTDKYHFRIKSTASGSTVRHSSNKIILETEISVPKKPKEQQKIASCLSSLDALITAQAEKIEQLKLHKKGLMQGLFPRIND